MNRLLLSVLILLGSMGCQPHHMISFQDISYTIDSPRQDADVIVVIDQYTLNKTVPIRSWMTGIAHSWDARPGEMLKQISGIELHQMFKGYEQTSVYKEPNSTGKALTLQLSIPHYAFDDFRAFVEVEAIVYGPNKNLLFNKNYMHEGETQGAKMFFAGAFGMKSAIRQSSFDAFKKIFVDLRADLMETLNKL